MKLTWTKVLLLGLLIGMVLGISAYCVLTLIGWDLEGEQATHEYEQQHSPESRERLFNSVSDPVTNKLNQPPLCPVVSKEICL